MYAVPKPEFRQLELGSVALKLRTVVSPSRDVLQPRVTVPLLKAFNHNAVSNHLTQVPRVPMSDRTVQFCSTEEMVSAVGVDAICCGYQITIEVRSLARLNLDLQKGLQERRESLICRVRPPQKKN
jgi:hypothetical protein